MSAVASSARADVERLVGHVERKKRSRMVAYHDVAQALGRSASWVRSVIRGEGSITAQIKDRLDALLVKEIEAEIVRLQAELALARQSGAHPASLHYSEIEAHLAKAKALMLRGGIDARDGSSPRPD
jgi:plasmid maintenance system antidote protein VapI